MTRNLDLKGVKRAAARALNRALKAYGLRLDYIHLDFGDFPLDGFTRRRIMKAMAAAYENWIASQTVFEVAAKFEVVAATTEFFEQWLALPFREPQGGSRFNNLLWLHLIARSYCPDIIVDSGTFQGASAWALSSGRPAAEALSFDVDLSQLAYRCKGVTYIEQDWSQSKVTVASNARVLAYFDDHIDQVRRLIEAADRGCGVALFDDDYPVTSFYAMAPSPSVLPKLEFALDQKLQEGMTLEWTARGARHAYRIDRTYLDQGLSRMRATERLPDTGLITGILQTPYRIVSFNRL